MNRKKQILNYQFQIARRLALLAAVLAVATRVWGADPPAFTNTLGSVFRQIPSGEFLMGSSKDYTDAMAAKVTYDWYRNSPPSETPQRRVKISRPIWVAIHEATLGEFRQFVTASGYVTDAERDGKGAAGKRDGKWVGAAPEFSWKNLGYERPDNEPVNNVSWNDAVAFCAWLSKKEGVTYRLPTEAEWEYACRAGTTTPFFWGDDESKRNDYVWSGGNADGMPHPVGQLKPNAWGLHDMNGNVYEYTADGWSTNILATLDAKDPTTLLTDPRVPANVEWVVLRSGSWGTAPIHCRSAFRGGADKTHRNHRDGFRVVREFPRRAAPVLTEANRMSEVSFESAKDYADPFGGVTLDAVFTTPDGRLLRVPAFWAGGNTWRVRYASPNTGTHRFRTECNDPANAALHGVTGEVEVKAYTGSNPLFRHGTIRVADDRRHFAYADGTPFFWLGDTWWMGLAKRLTWPADFQELTANRRGKGFTVIQIVAGLYPDQPAFDERALGDGGLPWEKLYRSIRPEYFDAADQRIQHLVEQGLTPCILGCWGYHLPWLGTEKMKQHWRYLIARWGALPVVWCTSGEQAMPWYNSGNQEAETQQLRREWTEVTRSIRATDPFHRLITTHPRSNARDELLDPTLLDFEMQQSGHGSPAEQHAAKALTAWNRPPVVPVISGESRYEALEIKPMLHAKEAREAFWAHLLNSGCAGHTYGVNGVWQVNLPDQRFGKAPSGNDWGGTPWREAMNLPGSTQLAHAKKFLLTLPWHQLAPSTTLFTEATSAAATADGRCALAFSMNVKAMTASLTQFGAPVTARWFDPASGELKTMEGSPFPNTAAREFVPPGMNAAGESDWVLVLETK